MNLFEREKNTPSIKGYSYGSRCSKNYIKLYKIYTSSTLFNNTSPLCNLVYQQQQNSL